MQLFRAAVNIHQKQVVQQEVFDKIVLVIPLLICHQKALNLERRHLADLIAGFILALDLYHIFRHAVVINLKILIAQNQLAFRGRGDKIFHRVNLASNHVFLCGGNHLSFLLHNAQFLARDIFQPVDCALQNLIGNHCPHL